MRRPGGSEKKGGRKQASCEAVTELRAIVQTHTAGSPVEPGRLWTNRSPSELCEALADAGFELCPNTVARLLSEELGLSRRKIAKALALGASPDRNAQFEWIAELKAKFLGMGWPVISIDSKKKELLGDFARAGRAFTDGLVKGFDHDFPSAATGKAIPYGVYDVTRNEALVLLAEGADTGELACDAIRRWWFRLGEKKYWRASGLLVLADSGGSNGRRVPLFRQRLCELAQRLRRPIRVAHLPPYCSKYNPIDHRLFCHLTRSLAGVLTRTMQTIYDAFARVTTSTGLRVVVEHARRKYQAGVKASREFLDNEPILRDNYLPAYNYTAPAVW